MGKVVFEGTTADTFDSASFNLSLEIEKVLFKFGSPTRAAIVQPYEDSEDREMLMLVMPMRLNA